MTPLALAELSRYLLWSSLILQAPGGAVVHSVFEVVVIYPCPGVGKPAMVMVAVQRLLVLVTNE